MQGLMAPEVMEQMGVLQAILNDPAHQKRMAALVDAQREAQDRIEAATAQESKNAEMLREAQSTMAEARKVAAEAAEHEARVRDLETRVDAVNRQITAERARWEVVRAQVDGEHATRHSELTERENIVRAAEDESDTRAERLSRAEAAHKRRSSELITLVCELRGILDRAQTIV